MQREESASFARAVSQASCSIRLNGTPGCGLWRCCLPPAEKCKEFLRDFRSDYTTDESEDVQTTKYMIMLVRTKHPSCTHYRSHAFTGIISLPPVCVRRRGRDTPPPPAFVETLTSPRAKASPV